MPVLEKAKYEQFAQNVAKGVSATQAYISAGYSPAGAAASATRLLKNAKVCSRIRELQETLAAGVIALEICSRNARVQASQNRWERLRRGFDLILEERGADMSGREASLDAEGKPMADAEPPVPGGSSGLLCRDYKGKDATQPVYKVDTGIIGLAAEIRNHEKQAAQELGQWSEEKKDDAPAGLKFTGTFEELLVLYRQTVATVATEATL
jgi:Terminase small subunit